MKKTTKIYAAILTAKGSTILMTPEMQFAIASEFDLPMNEEFDANVIARFIDKNVKKDIDLDTLTYADGSKGLAFKVKGVWHEFKANGEHEAVVY